MFSQKSSQYSYSPIHNAEYGILRPPVDSHAMQAYFLGSWFKAGAGISPQFVLPYTVPNALLVFLVATEAATETTPSSLTFNSESYTRVAYTTSAARIGLATYYRVNPTPGSGQITDLSGADFNITAYLISGVNQSSPVADSTTSTGATPLTVTVTNSVKGILTYAGTFYSGGDIGRAWSTDGNDPYGQWYNPNSAKFASGWKRIDGSNGQVTIATESANPITSVVSWSPA